MLLTYEKGKKDKIHISIDGEYKLTVDAVFWYGLGIKNKSEIDEDAFNELAETILSRRAYNKAIELLSRREHSRKEITEKLNQRGYQAVSDSVADKLTEKGYLDDERFAAMYAGELKSRKSMGKRRIKQELLRKGIDRNITENVIENIEEDPTEEIIDIIKRKYPKYNLDEKSKTRATNGLIRLGYSFSDIKNALIKIDNEDNFDYDI